MHGYGNGAFAIGTGNPAAQAFLSNGMELAAAFEHAASKAAFAEAVALDPACVMCAWGTGLGSRAKYQLRHCR